MKFQPILCALLLGAACSGEVTTGKSPSEVVDLITDVNPTEGGNRPGDVPAGEPYCGCDAILEFCPSFGQPCEGERCAQVCDSTGSVCIQCDRDGGCAACPADTAECQSFTCEQWYDACQSACRASVEDPPLPPPGTGNCPEGTEARPDGLCCRVSDANPAGSTDEDCFPNPNPCPQGTAGCDPTTPPQPPPSCEGGRCCPDGTYPTADGACCREGGSPGDEDCYANPCPAGMNCDPTTPPTPDCPADDPTCRCEAGAEGCPTDEPPHLPGEPCPPRP